jgi:hypothetical protein
MTGSNRRVRRATEAILDAGASHLGERDRWIDAACRKFVSPSEANRKIYRYILECAWPRGSGLPAPAVTNAQLRAYVDSKRGGTYQDVFRRLRELQGEEGIIGLIRVGGRIQLQHLKEAAKRQPRKAMSRKQWEQIVTADGSSCAICGRHGEADDFEPDHKVPRLRGGADDAPNLQPLCRECNNFKSACCRGCDADCAQCVLCEPTRFHSVTVGATVLESLAEEARRQGVATDDLLKAALLRSLRRSAE